jgi:hypothetical protein
LYEEGAVTGIRSQMTDGGWSPMIDVQNKKQNKGLTVYSYTSKDGTSPNGVTVISTDPGEITVLNLVGDIDLDALADVGATLGMPAMSIATTELGEPKLPLPPAPKKNNSFCAAELEQKRPSIARRFCWIRILAVSGVSLESLPSLRGRRRPTTSGTKSRRRRRPKPAESWSAGTENSSAGKGCSAPTAGSCAASCRRSTAG